jgi:hypothetical protein
VTLGAPGPYLLRRGGGRRFPAGRLGPRRGAALVRARQWLAGWEPAARHVRPSPPALPALAVITVHRLCFGVLTLVTLLFFRGHRRPGRGSAGRGGGGGAGAVGTLLAAAVTPRAVRRLGTARGWPCCWRRRSARVA